MLSFPRSLPRQVVSRGRESNFYTRIIGPRLRGDRLGGRRVVLPPSGGSWLLWKGLHSNPEESLGAGAAKDRFSANPDGQELPRTELGLRTGITALENAEVALPTRCSRSEWHKTDIGRPRRANQAHAISRHSARRMLTRYPRRHDLAMLGIITSRGFDAFRWLLGRNFPFCGVHTH